MIRRSTGFLLLVGLCLLQMGTIAWCSSERDSDRRLGELRAALGSIAQKMGEITGDGKRLVVETSDGMTKSSPVLEAWPSYERLPALLRQMFGAELPLSYLLWHAGLTPEDQFLVDDKASLQRAIKSSPEARLPLLLSVGRSPAYNCPLAFRGLVADGWREHHKEIREFIALFQSKPSLSAEIHRRPSTLFDHVKVEKDWCHSVTKLGGKGDGSKQICNLEDIRGPCVIYSFGGSTNAHFEIDARRLLPQCEVHTFDPTPGIIEKMSPVTSMHGIQYHAVGVGSHRWTARMGTTPVEIDSVLSIMRQLNHSFVDIFKIDVEGAEYDSLNPLLFNDCALLPPIGQIQIEVHSWIDRQFDQLTFFLPALERCGFRPFFSEASGQHEFAFFNPCFEAWKAQTVL